MEQHSGTWSIRKISTDDIDTICRHREQMFRESARSGRTDEKLATMTKAFRAWLEPRLQDGSYFGYVAGDKDKVVAGVGLMIIDWPPHPLHPEEDKRGYVLNVFVEPTHRQRGIARQLLALADEEFKRRQVTFLILHSTSMGRPVYERLGWSSTTEMSKLVS